MPRSEKRSQTGDGAYGLLTPYLASAVNAMRGQSLARMSYQNPKLATNEARLDPSWYWENPEVTQLLEKTMAIDPDDIQKQLGEHNVALLAHAAKTYEGIYGT